MSYRKTYHGTISGTVSGSFSYPKSESGGSRNVTLNYQETVTVNIDVDTSPVDQGIAVCRQQLDGLERSIRSGAAGQVAEKIASTARIVGAVTTGFNGLVFSEVNQKLVALSGRVQAASSLLVGEMQEAAKREIQFTADFQRIKERYASLFNTLDAELDRRIRMLDEPVFGLVRNDFRARISAQLAGQPAKTALYATELDPAAGLMSAGLHKSRIIGLIDAIRHYLVSLARTRGEMARILRAQGIEASVDVTVPAMFVEKAGPDSSVIEVVSSPDPRCPALDAERIKRKMVTLPWALPAAGQAEIVKRHFMEFVDRSFETADPAQRRKADLTVRLMNENTWLTTH